MHWRLFPVWSVLLGIGVQCCLNRFFGETISRDRILSSFGIGQAFGQEYLDHATFDNVDLPELPIDLLSLHDLKILLYEYCKIKDSQRAVGLIARRNQRIPLWALAIRHEFYRSAVIPIAFDSDVIGAHECAAVLMNYSDFSLFEALNWVQMRVGQEEKVSLFVSCVLMANEREEGWRAPSGIVIPR